MVAQSPVAALLAVAEIGGKLGIAGDKLRMLLPPDTAPEFKDAIRPHKPGLLALLQLDFLIVRADQLNATVIWTRDEQTKAALIAAGAEAGTIYTAAELETLVKNRVTCAQLSAIHAAKLRFNGRLTEL